MAEKQDKAPGRNPEPADKGQARRDRQAQALRENLRRRKAQARGRLEGAGRQGRAERPGGNGGGNSD